MPVRSRVSLSLAKTAFVLAVLLLGTPALPQEQNEDEALRLFRELYERKTALMARLAQESPDVVPLAEEVLELSARLFGPHHPEIVNGMTHLAFAQRLAGDLLEARVHFEVAVGLAEKLLGEDHSTTGMVLDHFGTLLQELGEVEAARERLERALVIQERAMGTDSLEAAVVLNNLGNLLHRTGDLAGARSRLTKALEILERQLGPDHVETATATNNLAMLLLEAGDLTGARALMNKALATSARQLGWEHPSVAIDLNNLGRVLHEIGDLGNARRRLEQALEIQEKTLPSDHPSLAGTLVNLGGVLRDLGLHAEAEEHLSRALEIQTRTLGEDHPQIACTLGSLGMIARFQGEAQKAGELFGRAAEIRRRHPEPIGLGIALNNLACEPPPDGDSGSAEQNLRRAIALTEQTLGSDHPDLVTLLINLATHLEAARQFREAVELTTRALDLEERALAAMVGLGSLEEAGLFLGRMSWSTSWALSLHALSAPADSAAVRLGLTTVLRRKGRELETSARPQGALDDPEADELAAALRRTREAWGFLELRTLRPQAGDDTRQWCVLSDRMRLLSGELRGVYHQLGKPPAEITIEAVQQRIPDRAALVEFLLFHPIGRGGDDVGAGAEDRSPRYLAYVLRDRGEPAWADLGDAAAVDLLVDAFRDSLSQRGGDVLEHARRLDQATMARLRPLAGDAETILISPDGALNLVPFAALVDERGEYLVERYRLSYLSSGRDLLRGEAPRSRQPPLVVGGPAFDAGAEPWPAGTAFEDAGGFRDLRFPSLAGAGDEARAIAATLGLPPDRILTGEAAREAAIKAVRGPRILHLATHGFFLGDPTPEPVELPACLEEGVWSLDPLLASGLALSAVPRGAATASEDGILTALEVMDLDLAGTEIVTLSACRTGVGEVRPGRGVFGLRRALVLAGARTQVMSLWPVADQATAALMTSWYAQLEAREARGEALRAIQLAALGGKALPVTEAPLTRGARPVAQSFADPRLAGDRHPYYWASFILVGYVGPLPGVAGNPGPE